MTRPGGYNLSALGSRLSALGSRLSALGSRLSGSRLSALGSRLSLLSASAKLSASATACRGPLRPSTCRHHAPRGTAPLHSRGRHPRLRRGHRPSAARRGIGPSPPGGRAVPRPIRRWCAVTASLVVYPAGKSHRLKLRPRPPSRITVSCDEYSTKKFYESNAYNFTTSIGIPRTACKFDEFDEYEGSPAHRRRAPVRRPRVRALARPCLGPAAVAHLPGHADAPSRPAYRQHPPRREGRGGGVHERGIARTIAGTLHGIVAGAPWHSGQPCGTTHFTTHFTRRLLRVCAGANPGSHSGVRRSCREVRSGSGAACSRRGTGFLQLGQDHFTLAEHPCPGAGVRRGGVVVHRSPLAQPSLPSHSFALRCSRSANGSSVCTPGWSSRESLLKCMEI